MAKKIKLTPELIERLELVLAMAYNYANTSFDNEEFELSILDAHTTWVQICTENGGNADLLQP